MSAERYGSDTTTNSPPRLERRRPGARVSVNPALIPLLRGQGVWDEDRAWFKQHEIQYDPSPDPLSAARGFAFAIVVCGTFWLGVASLF